MNLFAETVQPIFFDQMTLFEDLECSFLESLYFRFRFGFVSQWNKVSLQSFGGFWSDFPLKYMKTEIWIWTKSLWEVHYDKLTMTILYQIVNEEKFALSIVLKEVENSTNQKYNFLPKSYSQKIKKLCFIHFDGPWRGKPFLVGGLFLAGW